MRYGCYCELEDGQEPDECVIGSEKYTINDCVHAHNGVRKDECEHWRPIDDTLLYDREIENRFQIAKMISCYFSERTPISMRGAYNVDKTDIMDYVMRIGHGHYNPEMVSKMINIFFGDDL